MALTRIDTSTDVVITFDGTANIADINTIGTKLRTLLEIPTPLVTFDLKGIESVDVSFFQLLLALNNGLNTQNRHLMLRTLPNNHVVIETATLLGINLKHHITMVEASA